MARHVVRPRVPMRLSLRMSLLILAGSIFSIPLLYFLMFFAALGPFQAATPKAFAIFLTMSAPIAALVVLAGPLAPVCAMLEKVICKKYVGFSALATCLAVVLVAVLARLPSVYEGLLFWVAHS